MPADAKVTPPVSRPASPPVTPRVAPSSATSRLLTLFTSVALVVVLYLGREVFIPLALAVLLTFLLAPLVNRVQRLGFGRVGSVLVVTALSFGVIGAVGYVAVWEGITLAEQLPQYRQNIREKVQALSLPTPLTKATQNLRDIGEEVMKATTMPATQPDEEAGAGLEEPLSGGAEELEASEVDVPPKPIPVVPMELEPSAWEYLRDSVMPFLAPLASAGIVIVFVIFMLIQREDLRDRIIRLVGPGQINLTTQVLNEAAARVSRYLLMLFIVNATYGIPVAIGLHFIGLPTPILWGLLAMLLRFLPYVGPWLGASMPVLLSLGYSEGWTQPAMVIALFIVLELISNNIVEPLLYGSGTGLSPVAVLLAAVFWTWLWGPVGLILATPLTVCLVVLGQHFPQMQWLSILLSDQPGLPLEARVYQRLLAMDHDEVYHLVHQHVKKHSLLESYEQVLVPALQMAERDRHRGLLDSRREEAVFQSVRDLIEELTEQFPRPKERDAEPDDDRPCAVCLPARDEADELAGLMLAHLLEIEGYCVEVVSTDQLAAEVLEIIEKRKPTIVCVSAMPPMAVMHSRYMCKRISTRFPDLPILVAVWNASDLARAKQRITSRGAEIVVSTFTQAMDRLRR